MYCICYVSDASVCLVNPVICYIDIQISNGVFVEVYFLDTCSIKDKYDVQFIIPSHDLSCPSCAIVSYCFACLRSITRSHISQFLFQKISPEGNAVHHTAHSTDTPDDRMSNKQHTCTFSTHVGTNPGIPLNATAPRSHQTLPPIFTSRLQAGNNFNNNTGVNGSEYAGTTQGNVDQEGKIKHNITTSGAPEAVYGRPYAMKGDSAFGIKKKKKKKKGNKKKRSSNKIEAVLD